MKAEALKARIKAIAQERKKSHNEIWKQLLLERFLARLSHSNQHDKFIFKGGLLLAQYLAIGRETTDADFLVNKMKSETAAIETSLREVVAIDLNDDFTFTWGDIENLIQPHMEYAGFRVTFNVSLEKMKDRIQIDLGVGDAVDAIQNQFRPFEYKGKPIFEGEISLLTYPVETIFAEKFETIISKGATNSRMKDYHDVILMSREPNLIDSEKLRNDISQTFAHRGTLLTIPVSFDSEEILALQKLWTQHLRGLGESGAKLNLPKQMSDVLNEMNAWIAKRLRS
jgi:predicted nucleotidyltransferase component of viral defense system